jgi:hypothetical protein
MRTFILTLLVSLGTIAMAQDSFEVFYIKGSASLVSGDGSRSLTRGMKFTNGTLSLGDNSMVVLMNTEGRNLKISNQGEYGAKDISKLYKKTKGDITSDYFRYVWEEMKETDEETDVARVKGSVYRGDIMMFFPPDSCIVSDYEINFTWKGGHETNYFRILSGDRLYFNMATSDTTLQLFIDSEALDPGIFYSWEVGSTNPPPQNYPPFHFKIPTSNELDTFEAGISQLQAEMDYPKDMECIILAGYAAQNKYYLRAIGYFEMAKQFTEDPAMVEHAYAAFLQSIMRTE